MTVNRCAGAVLAVSLALTASGCQWNGLNSLPLPGAVGHGQGAMVLHVIMSSVGTMESNSPVMIDDVVVGSVGALTVRDWNADVEVFVKKGVVVPANAVATLGQTSLLGTSHLELGPPPGAAPVGVLTSGATIPLERTSAYPSTEQTLSSLSMVLNAGGLGQIQDVVSQVSAAIGGRGVPLRDLLHRLDTFVGTLADQQDNIVATIDGLNRLATQIAGQSAVVESALRKIPDGLRVLEEQRPNLVTALEKLHTFSDTLGGVVTDVKDNLITDLNNLEPTLKAIAAAGNTIGKALEQATVFPWAQYVVDDAVKGDYANLFATLDLTNARFKRELLSGTRWAEDISQLPGVIGSAPSLTTDYTNDPLGAPAAPPPDQPPPVPPDVPLMPDPATNRGGQ